MSKGTTAGVVIAAIVAVTVFAGGVFYCTKVRNRRATAPEASLINEGVGSGRLSQAEMKTPRYAEYVDADDSRAV